MDQSESDRHIVQQRMSSPDEAMAAIISASKLRDTLCFAGEEYAKAKAAGDIEAMQSLAIISALGAVDTFLRTALSQNDGLQARLMVNDIAEAIAAASDWKTRKNATKDQDNAPHPLLEYTGWAGREMGIGGLYKPIERSRAIWGGIAVALIKDFGMSANEVRDAIGAAAGAARSTAADWEDYCAGDHKNFRIADLSRTQARKEIERAGLSYSRDNPPEIDSPVVKKLIKDAQNYGS